ncbi:hypothetical protein V5O48_013771 [Marasmius crinis-equi]|uniref:Uncharacterized protein n=1 Tax=Marasmius crinis-equi TaxID=585013 RepID=A0ABR3EZ66_9AGAR
MSSQSPDIDIQTASMESFSSSHLWPWLGLAELENALELLQLAFRNATWQNRSGGPVGSEVVDCCEWNAIADDCLDLNIAASKIYERHLQESIWWKYVGINPGLMPDIARWYTESEVLKRRLLKAQVKDKQNRFEAERYRRQSTQRTSAHFPTYESPFRYQRDSAAYNSFVELSSALAPANLTARARRGYLASNGATPIGAM